MSETAKQVKSITIVLIGVEVETEILNLPRVLVWTDDPDAAKGKNKPAYSLEEVRSLAKDALGGSGSYVNLVTDKEIFQNEFRSWNLQCGHDCQPGHPVQCEFLKRNA